MAKKYKAVFTPDDDGVRWNARIAGKPNGYGCGTWGRSLNEAHKRLRDALATALDDDEATRLAVIEPEYDIPLGAELSKLRARREKVDSAVRALADDSAATARRLYAEGYSMRDVAELIGTSHARVQQWVPAAPKTTAARKAAKVKVARKPAKKRPLAAKRSAAGKARPGATKDGRR